MTGMIAALTPLFQPPLDLSPIGPQFCFAATQYPFFIIHSQSLAIFHRMTSCDKFLLLKCLNILKTGFFFLVFGLFLVLAAFLFGLFAK